MRQLKITQSITNRASASLEKYLQDIAHEELLSTDEEVELAQRIRKGDRRALERLTKANLRFVVSVAKQYQNHGISLPDLINEGNVGLIKAAQKFDETRGFKFISYAVWWIRQSILQAIAEQSRIVRLPQNQVGSVNKINREMSKFEQEFERKPSVDEMADRVDLPEDKIENAMLDLMANSDDPTDNELLTESLRAEIERLLKTLPDKDQKIIAAFYGIGTPELTLEEIGTKYHLTRERVRQIKDKTIRRLRNSTTDKLLKSYLG